MPEPGTSGDNAGTHESADEVSTSSETDAPPSPPARTRRISGRARTRHRWSVLTPILALSFLFYYFTGTTEGNPVTFGTQSDFYNRLTTAFEHGSLSLLVHPPRGLLALKNPYDPIQNAPWQPLFHDLALYRGHLFLTWGPTPVVTLLLPWRLLHLGQMPLNLAIVLYCWTGLLCSVGLLCFLVDRFLPATKPWQLAVATVGLALSNVAPFLLRRPAEYELAISSAYCFVMLGLYLLAIGGLWPRLRPWALVAGSFSLGLAIGGRPDLIFVGIFPLALLIFLLRRPGSGPPPSLRRLVSLLLAPFAVVMILLFVYNDARFGSILQNGTSYVMAGYDPSKMSTFQLSYLLPGLAYYFVYPVRWTLAFPFFTLGPPPTFPITAPSYYSSELTGGVLTTTPILIALIPGMFYVWRRRQRELAYVLTTFLLVTGLIVLVICVVLWGTTMRYEMDFVPLLLVPALMSWFALCGLRRRRLVAVLGTVAIAYGALAGLAFSIYGYYDELRTTDPGTYWALTRITSPIPTVITMIEGHPVITRVVEPVVTQMGNSGTYDIGSTVVQLSTVPVELDIISPASGSWELDPTFSRAPGAGTSPVDIVVHVHGRSREVSVGTRPTGLAVPLEQGLNRIQVTAVSPDVHSAAVVAIADGFDLSSTPVHHTHSRADAVRP